MHRKIGCDFRSAGKSPSERGRNYTPLREVVHCALPGAVSAAAPVDAEPTSTGRCAPCGQQMISVDFQSAPIITGEARLPLRWLCQLPLCGLATRKFFRKHIPFSKLKLYNNRASEKPGVVGVFECDRIGS
jgi:hypothetical protein